MGGSFVFRFGVEDSSEGSAVFVSFDSVERERVRAFLYKKKDV